jgi:hypothetical protein
MKKLLLLVLVAAASLPAGSITVFTTPADIPGDLWTGFAVRQVASLPEVSAQAILYPFHLEILANQDEVPSLFPIVRSYVSSTTPPSMVAALTVYGTTYDPLWDLFCPPGSASVDSSVPPGPPPDNPINVVPEPASLLGAAGGLVLLVWASRRNRKRATVA